MTTLSELNTHMRDILKRADNPDTAALDARLLIQYALTLSHADIISNANLEICSDKEAELLNLVARRAKGEPVSKIIGFREFYGRDFIVTKDTLDPRPETEILIEQVLKWAKGHNNAPKIIDLGTGTGCIALTLALELPNACVTCVDISGAALDIAKQNAKKHKVSDRVRFVQSSWFENIDESYDILVSNPPYIPRKDIESLSKDVRFYDPILALEGGEDGLDPYKIIFSKLSSHLKCGGSAFFEIGFLQSEDITRLAEEARIRIVGITPDIAGIPRVVEISADI